VCHLQTLKAESKAELVFQHSNSTSYVAVYGTVKLQGNCRKVISSEHFILIFILFFFLKISTTEVKTLENVALKTARRK